MNSRVILVECTSYERETIVEELRWAVDQLGGAEAFCKKGEQILLKPNLLRKVEKGSVAVTHPLVVSAAARIFQETGCRLICGDSAGIGSTEKIAEACGLSEEMEKLHIPIDPFSECITVAYPEGRMAKSFEMSKTVADADGVISICKMKTHQLEKMTGAVKNSYGFIQGLHKAQGHTKYNNAESFARMLVDLNRCVAPRLYIMDGISAMEGNGPASGTPIDMGVMLVSTDPVALDSVCASLMYLKPELVPTNAQGEKMGLGTWREDNIEVVTRQGIRSISDIQKKYGREDYDVNRGKELRLVWRNLRWIGRFFQRKPYIDESKCIRCGICVDACPVEGKAIHLNRPAAPVYDYKKCIACFCCQEMCPQKAIKVK